MNSQRVFRPCLLEPTERTTQLISHESGATQRRSISRKEGTWRSWPPQSSYMIVSRFPRTHPYGLKPHDWPHWKRLRGSTHWAGAQNASNGSPQLLKATATRLGLCRSRLRHPFCRMQIGWTQLGLQELPGASIQPVEWVLPSMKPPTHVANKEF